MRRFVTVGPAFVVLLTALVTLVAAPAAVRRISFAHTEARVRMAMASLDADDLLERINAATRSIAELTEPSVVHISTDARRRGGWGRSSQGSGWVFDREGHIITNAHVVRDGRRIRVQFSDSRTMTAQIIGMDETTDIAVLRVQDREGLFPARRGRDVRVRQGDRVYAFGSPFGFKFSMSEGIVSGVGRDPQDVIRTPRGGYTNFIQTDAAVNPGNSGGPLIDINGRVVGMNVAIATGSDADGVVGEGQSAGISFAIPVATIESVASQLIESGVVTKGFLGIVHNGSDEDNATALLDLQPGLKGVYINDVSGGGPAAMAGMRGGDVIVSIAGVDIDGLAPLRSEITNHRAGETVQIEYFRDGVIRATEVTLEDLSRTGDGRARAMNALLEYGIRTADGDSGVLIEQVENGSRADIAGLETGELIIEVNDRRVASVQAMLDVFSDAGFLNGRRVDAVVLSEGGRERDLAMRLVD